MARTKEKRFWSESDQKKLYKEMVAEQAEKHHARDGAGADWEKFEKGVEDKFKRRVS